MHMYCVCYTSTNHHIEKRGPLPNAARNRTMPVYMESTDTNTIRSVQNRTCKSNPIVVCVERTCVCTRKKGECCWTRLTHMAMAQHRDCGSSPKENPEVHQKGSSPMQKIESGSSPKMSKRRNQMKNHYKLAFLVWAKRLTRLRTQAGPQVGTPTLRSELLPQG